MVCNALALGHLTEDLLGTGDAESAEDNSGKSGRVGGCFHRSCFGDVSERKMMKMTMMKMK